MRRAGWLLNQLDVDRYMSLTISALDSMSADLLITFLRALIAASSDWISSLTAFNSASNCSHLSLLLETVSLNTNFAIYKTRGVAKFKYSGWYPVASQISASALIIINLGHHWISHLQLTRQYNYSKSFITIYSCMRWLLSRDFISHEGFNYDWLMLTQMKKKPRTHTTG